MCYYTSMCLEYSQWIDKLIIIELQIVVDINECLLHKDNCHANARCDNLKGSFNCTCNQGYQGNGSYCEGKVVKNSI